MNKFNDLPDILKEVYTLSRMNGYEMFIEYDGIGTYLIYDNIAFVPSIWDDNGVIVTCNTVTFNFEGPEEVLGFIIHDLEDVRYIDTPELRDLNNE